MNKHPTGASQRPSRVFTSDTSRPLALALALALAATAALPAFAQEGRMLNTRDAGLEWAYIDRIASGAGIPTTIQSISAREARYYGLDVPGVPSAPYGADVPANTLPSANFPESASARSEDDPSSPSFSARVEIQPVALGWKGLDRSRDLKNESLLDRFRLDDPVFLIGLSFASGSLFGATSVDFGTDSLTRYAEDSGLTGFWKPLDFLSYWTFPEEGYLSWSDRHLTVAAGRLRTGIGLGENNVFLNGNARWYDQVQLSWWSDKFRFFAFWGTSSAHLDEGEYKVQSYLAQYFDDESKRYQENWGWDYVNNHDAATQSVVPFKMFTYHRFEFKPDSRVGFGVAEMQLVGGKVPDLTNLLPTVTWHNTYTAGVSNVMLQADAWVVPVKGLLAYGEFLMDDSRAPKETGATKPNCWGWELGAKAALPIASRDWRLSLAGEYSHVDKWTYSRWQPYLTMYQRQLITGGHRGFDIPLGHPEGGDVDEVDARFVAIARDGRRIEAGYSWICKGPVYLGTIAKLGTETNPIYIPVYYDYDDIRKEPGALDLFLGTTRRHSHGIMANVTWPLAYRLEANAGIDVRYVFNARHEAGERATEILWKVGLKWGYGN